MGMRGLGIYAAAWLLLLWSAGGPAGAARDSASLLLSDRSWAGLALALALAGLVGKLWGARWATVLVSLTLIAGLAYAAATAPPAPGNLVLTVESDGAARAIPEGASRVGGGTLAFRYRAVPGALVRWGFHAGDRFECPLDQRHANIHDHVENLTLGEIRLEEVDEVRFCASVHDRKLDLLLSAAGRVRRLAGGGYEVAVSYGVRDLEYERNLLFLAIGMLAGSFLDTLRERLGRRRGRPRLPSEGSDCFE